MVGGDGRYVGRHHECLVRVDGGHHKARVEPHLES